MTGRADQSSLCVRPASATVQVREYQEAMWGEKTCCTGLAKAPLTCQEDLALLLLENRKHWAVFSLSFLSESF